jgi:ribonucleoside-diphosphate reductase alpha chain
MYWSPESIKSTDVLFKELAYATLRSSVDLAKERWAYPMFEWSEYSKWRAFWKEVNELFWNYWLPLYNDMKQYWTRFGYHSSPAPNTSTAWVVWTTAGVVPVYKKYFVETNQIKPTVTVAPNLNDENFWFYKEYMDLELSWVIDVVSAAQKWIDQSVSFEWMINPAKTSPKDLFNYFLKAHKQWLKTVYYVRSMSLEVESCDSCSG